MPTFRSIGSLFVGYLIFALSAIAAFQISGQVPHAEVTPGVMATTILVGGIAAFCGGYVTAQLAGRKRLAHGIALAVLIALGAASSLWHTLGHGQIWSQLAALVVMAPSAALGGLARAKRA